MLKQVLLGSFLLLFLGCSDSDERRLNNIVKTYIKEAHLDDEAYVTVDEIDFDSLYAYKISATFHFYVEDPPYEIEAIGDRYIFKFHKEASPMKLEDAPEIVQFREKYREFGVTYHPPEWIAFVCKNSGNQKVLKNSPPVERVDSSGQQYWWIASIDSIRHISDIIEPEEIENFRCS